MPSYYVCRCDPGKTHKSRDRCAEREDVFVRTVRARGPPLRRGSRRVSRAGRTHDHRIGHLLRPASILCLAKWHGVDDEMLMLIGIEIPRPEACRREAQKFQRPEACLAVTYLVPAISARQQQVRLEFVPREMGSLPRAYSSCTRTIVIRPWESGVRGLPVGRSAPEAVSEFGTSRPFRAGWSCRTLDSSDVRLGCVWPPLPLPTENSKAIR